MEEKYMYITLDKTDDKDEYMVALFPEGIGQGELETIMLALDELYDTHYGTVEGGLQ